VSPLYAPASNDPLAHSGEVEQHSGGKSNTIPEGSRTGFRADSEHQPERSDAGFLIVRKVFGLIKENEAG
jgi:hypothetical protein